jgi:hypothetical protein
MANTFSRMLTMDNAGEGFEVGHVMFKSSFDGTNYRILLLVPSVKSVLNVGCQFDNQFHNDFIGKSQDIQKLLAIKARKQQRTEALWTLSRLTVRTMLWLVLDSKKYKP